ncbi:chondroitin sulfate proteoglycan 4-like [Sinocyclocheilus anshuiensis]|uniref:chondroitin sulfate proteoglycan 4-like n=1 Tax=Sinocyclocheilus anshuiensis TaxID=1608454 RepID=UPI0007B9B903|nr:PREDICTED: chondroitin sulfate proteoglycan 4-like [Sinocyclocheilus anshuiensis]
MGIKWASYLGPTWVTQLGPTWVNPASYFGDSYCRIDAVQDLSSFQVSLQFKTSRRSGLLLLAAGHRDYLSLELYNGRLQARIDMGSGEKVLSSTMGLQLSNLLDHHVSLILKDSKLTMAVDNLYTTFIPAENEDEHLNIDQGVFLGGVRDLEVEYLSTAVPFLRGCMSNVMFESHEFDILASAATVCYDTKGSCSSEFEAGDGDTTSFISAESFISFPTWTRPSSGSRSLEMLMKTTIEDALLLFHPGHQTDFIAIGMAGGFLKGVMDLGSGMYVLDNVEVKVDDDQWHRVKVQIDRNEFLINVDSQTVSLPLNETEKLDLVGNLYLGGIQRKMKDVFQNYLARVEEEVTTESFIGCLGEIKVNQKGRSLQDALITKDIHGKCEGEYDYSTYDEDLELTTTPPVRITYINVNTDERHCFPAEELPEMFRNISRLLDITPMLVPEGGEANIDIVNLNPTFNLKAAGVRESEIIFTLLNDPWYGLVDMNLRQTRVKKFTLLDVVNKKIKYLHNGNERYGDQIQLEVTVHGTNLPECLSVARKYVLPVEIIPVNDIPQLSAGDISITANRRTRLSPNLIKISDSDNRCDELKITVTSDPTAAGYLENAQQPGFGLREFTCRQLKEGNIYYVHKGGEVPELTLQVSDGDSVSNSSTFKLLITQPQMTVVTNTGLLITQDDSTPIGIQNLAISATPETGDVVYNVTQPLQFGELQLISDDGVPKRVTLFHQSDLEQNRLKYIPNPTADLKGTETEFIHFNAQLGQVILPDNLFIIKIMPALIGIGKRVPLEVEVWQQKVIKPEQLQAFVMESNTDSRSIQYMITKSPVQGVLMMLDKELSDGDTFTQQDILSGFISYSPRVRRAVDFEDQFQFKVFAEDQYSRVYTFPIKIKADSDAPVLINERLVVLEGNESIINKEYLWVQSSTSTDFVYRIVQDPKHGRLIRDSPPGMQRFDGAIRVFSNEDLSLNRLVYKHDGSETSHDQFSFLAFDSRGGNGWQEEGHEVLRGVFNIAIQSRNDYVPQRVIHKPFNVIRNGQHLLTTEDILFRDDDLDFNDTQLVYVRVGILSGNIVSTADPTQPLYRFTQADLRDGKVLFVHHGADRERFQLQVSDGFHKTTAVLQVQAGDPYLRIANNNMVVMDHGSTKTLNTSLLSAETNMDIRSAAEIIYDVTSPPSDGRIIVSGIESSTFTQEDLTKGVVSYEHSDQSLSSKDSFAFTVQAKGWSTEGTFRIKIFKKGYLSQPKVTSNMVILAYEGEHSVIDASHLEVMQKDILPKEMVYSVKDFPRLGHVVKLNNDSDNTASPVLDYIQSFTQEDINLGRIFYVSVSLQGQDHFTVDVSNGFTTIEDLQVQVVIFPRIIPIQVVNLTVREGGSVALTQEVLNITHHFYRSMNIEFIMEEAPQHGDIKYLDEEDGLLTFTWEDVQQGQVYYFHDSSETTEDSFTLAAAASHITRRSASLTIGITILPVNDEPPRIQRNTGMELVAGEESEITANMLSSEDLDTPPEELVYAIETPSNGIVAFKVSPDDSMDSFTQAQINNGEVLFIHQGSEAGGFSFTVTDGEHTSPLHRFVVKARQLTISMETKGELMVFPGTRQVISGDILRAITSEDGDEITYSLVKPPRLGRIIKPNQRGQFEEITRFTQTELDAGAVYYEHQMPAEPFWVLKDSVELALTSPPATELHHSLPVTVSYYAANQNVSSQLWKNKGVSVVQGQSKVIDSSVLDASNLLASLPEQKRAGQDIVYEVRRFPNHGRLTLGGSDLPRDAPRFLQDDVARGDLEYNHDDSGASSDSFSFRVHLNPSGRTPQVQPGAVVLEEIFLISIRRRDSNPPELVSLDLLLEALQGSTTIISKNYLNTVDQDSTPDEVRFLISKSPANGYVIYTDSGDRIDQFSQEDINTGRVAFVSDGSLSNGFMEFIVSDGKHQTDPYTLHIGILAKSLILNKAPEIHVLQGDDETLITEDMLSTSTGGPVEEDVLYKITNVPKYAAVMVDRQPTSAFTQKQIKQGRVSVRFVKSTSPRDSVAFMARSRAANVSSVLNITVKPLAKVAQNPLLPRGATVLVDRKLLDATPLANKTRTSPTFNMIKQPQGARFVKRGGQDDGQPVSSFTQRDLDEGRVALEILNTTGGQNTGGQGQDEARFLLKAHGVPPAECVLPFHVVPYDPSRVYGATFLKVPPVFVKSDPGQAEPRWRGDGDVASGSTTATPVVSRRNTLWAILIPILVILLLMLLAAMLAYYLVRRNKTGKHNVQTVAAKPKNGEVSQETFRKTDPANNIPMSDMDSKGADPELIQHCRTTNPALKKNQYWV